MQGCLDTLPVARGHKRSKVSSSVIQVVSPDTVVKKPGDLDSAAGPVEGVFCNAFYTQPSYSYIYKKHEVQQLLSVYFQ